MNKYKNKKVNKYNRNWDSQMELEFYEYLLELQKAGEVLKIECQPVFLLQESFKYKDKTIRKMEYKADFRVKYLDGSVIVWDVKGQVTQCFSVKWKLVKYRYKDTDFRCIRSKGRKPNKVWEELKI